MSWGADPDPSAFAVEGAVNWALDSDAAPVEYVPFGLRTHGAAELIAGPHRGHRECYWQWDESGSSCTADAMRFAFLDDVTGLRVALCYEAVAGTDVLLRWVELTNCGATTLAVERADSAAVCVPTGPRGARVTYLSGRWGREFQRTDLVLQAGRLEIGSAQGLPGHSFAPWLAVQDAGEEGDGNERPTWGISHAWPGSWHIDAEIEWSGATRARAGRVVHEGALLLEPGASTVTPRAVLAFSGRGLTGLAQTWHDYERRLAGDRRDTRQIQYNAWYVSGFAVSEKNLRRRAQEAAELGSELFVVDDGWFGNRDNDDGGLGDWHVDETAFPRGLPAFIADVRALGMGFGLWIEPEAVSPRSRLYAEHPDWAYRLPGRTTREIRNQLVLDLGQEDVYRFVVQTLDRLLGENQISYLKWDMNRPMTERGRPGVIDPRTLDLDGAHARNYLRCLDHLRSAHPHVTIESCAGGGARADLATIARSDLVWPSDNTGPLDRLRIQFGFLHAHAPHLLSSWVTDQPDTYDERPRSLRFRFVTAMTGVLGIGSDIRRWTASQRRQAAQLIALYKRIRPTIQFGTVTLLGTPDDSCCAVQYQDGTRVVVLLWNTSDPPGRPDRLRLRDLDPAAWYLDEQSGARVDATQLMRDGLPVRWTAGHDADVVVLRVGQRADR